MPSPHPPRRRGETILSIIAALTCASTLATSVAAQPADEAASLATEGKKLLLQGKVEEACASFDQSVRARPDPQVILLLARCHERAKNPLAAYEAYARLGEDPASPVPLRLASQAGVAAQKRKLGLVVLEAPKLPKGARLTVAGKEASADAAAAVLPGDVIVEASAPGFKAWTQTVAVSPGATRTVTVPALEADVLQPLAADGDRLVKQRGAGGADWEPGLGFVGPIDQAGVPSERRPPGAMSLAAPPSLARESLDRFYVDGGVGWSSFLGTDALEAAFDIGGEYKTRVSRTALWWQVNLGATIVPDDDRVALAPRGRFGVDFRPAEFSPYLGWLSVGSFLGLHGMLVSDGGGDVGPEIGWLHLALFTAESAAAPSIVRLDGYLSDRVGVETTGTYLQGRLGFTLGTSTLLGVDAQYQLGARGDVPPRDLAAAQPLEARLGLFIGSGT